jgi:hypothetical protein
MTNFAKIKAQQLTWTQSQPFSTRYHLQDAQGLLARLVVQFHRNSFIGQADAAGEAWTFQYTRFVKPYASIRRMESHSLAGTFESSWMGEGIFHNTNGRDYLWHNSDPWTKIWKFMGEDENGVAKDNRLATFVWKPGLLKKSAQVLLARGALECEELPILMSLGMFLMLIPKQVRRSELIPGAKRA